MFYGIIIMMIHFDDKRHNLPHRHVEYQGAVAVIEIETAEIMKTIKTLLVSDEHLLIVEFSDGITKLVDLKPYFSVGIFSQLKDPGYFQLVKNNGYFITWPNDQELSADTLYYS